MMHVFISLFALTIIGESMLTAHERCGNDFIFERNLHACCNNIKYSIDVQSCCNGIIMAGACPGTGNPAQVIANDVAELPISNGPRVIIRSDYVYPVTDHIVEQHGGAVGNNENTVENAATDEVLLEEKIKNDIERDIEPEVAAEVEEALEAEIKDDEITDEATNDGTDDNNDGDNDGDNNDGDNNDDGDNDGDDNDGDDNDGTDGDEVDGVEKIATTEDATANDDSSSSDDSSSEEGTDGKETGDGEEDEFGNVLSERKGSHSAQNGDNNESLNGNMDYYVKITLINMWLILGLIVIVNVIFYWCYCRKNNRKNKLPSISSNNMFVDNHDHQTAGQLTDDDQV